MGRNRLELSFLAPCPSFYLVPSTCHKRRGSQCIQYEQSHAVLDCCCRPNSCTISLPPPFRYRGVSTSGKGDLVIGGLQLGNVFIGVQPLLGLEGDPMRLMFERDLTPHPQYAAFYEWLRGDQGFGAQVL